MIGSMVPEVRDEWISDLRSGEIPQGDGALRKGDNRCCLGVLCDQAVRKGVIPPPTISHGETYEYAGESGLLPPKVAEWAGLDGEDVRINFDGGYDRSHEGRVGTYLSSANDFGWSFAEIADEIERQL